MILGGRPGRNRGRINSEHQQYVNVDGVLYPADALNQGIRRSASSSGYGRRSPTQIFISNSSRPRSVHYNIDESDDEWDTHGQPREERRHRPRGRSHGHHEGHDRHPSPIPVPPPMHHPHPPPHDPEIDAKLRKLHELEEKEMEEERRRKYAEEQALKRMAEEEKKRKEEEMKKATIAEYNAKQLEKAAKEKKDKEEAEKEFRERVKTTFGKAGYSDENIERILQREGNGGHEGQKRIVDLTRPTYIKVHRKHLSPDTLDAYGLPWEFDDRDGNYILIKRWIPEHEQDILFEHTRRMREGRLLTNSKITLKKEHGERLLVRKKSPVRRRSISRGWIFT